MGVIAFRQLFLAPVDNSSHILIKIQYPVPGLSQIFQFCIFIFRYGARPTESSMFADKSGLLTLHYGKHHVALVDEMKMWFVDESFTDVVIVCEDDETPAVDTPPPLPEPSKLLLKTRHAKRNSDLLVYHTPNKQYRCT